jgi:hypothetical protein
LRAVLHNDITRILNLLSQQSAIVEWPGSACLVAIGPRAEQKVPTVRCAMPRSCGFAQAQCATRSGLSLHAAVR